MAIGVDATPVGLDEMAIGLDKTAIGLASALHDMALALIRPLVLTGNGLARLLAFLVQLGQVCSGRFPCKASPHKARLCPRRARDELVEAVACAMAPNARDEIAEAVL